MVSAAISANPLKLDVKSHAKCLGICFLITLSTFQYGESLRQHDFEPLDANDCLGLDYALVGGFLS